MALWKTWKVTSDGLVLIDKNQRPKFMREYRDDPPSQTEVEHAKKYISEQWVPASTVTRGSYGMKHWAEQWGHEPPNRGYVSNGALIAAAVALGFRVEPDGSGINAKIYAKRRKLTEEEFLKRIFGG